MHSSWWPLMMLKWKAFGDFQQHTMHSLYRCFGGERDCRHAASSACFGSAEYKYVDKEEVSGEDKKFIYTFLPLRAHVSTM